MSSGNTGKLICKLLVMHTVVYLAAAAYLLIIVSGLNSFLIELKTNSIMGLIKAELDILLGLLPPFIYSFYLSLSVFGSNPHLSRSQKTTKDSIISEIPCTKVVNSEARPDRIASDEKTDFNIPSSEVRSAGEISVENSNRQNCISSKMDEVESSHPDQILIDRLNRDLILSEQQLQQLRGTRSHFLANISHELRTPMNGILGMNELLIGSGLSDRQVRYANSVRRSAEALLSIINDLLDYSSMESGKVYLEKAAFNLGDLVEDICDLQESEAQAKGLELICDVDRSISTLVIGDANRIRQLLNNLISNAIKFTKKGEIIVRLIQTRFDGTDATFRIDVVDTGIGISPEGQARIFDSFTQADISKSREFEGSGLGLFIAQKLAIMMDGSITLRSRMQEGSQFSVTLKLKPTTGETQSKEYTDTLQGVRILIVDDNETNRTILFHQLRSWGVEPEVADSGARALDILRDAALADNPFEAAILDLHMPEMDGIELSRKIQSDSEMCKIKRMMLTSSALDMSEEALHKIGITQYVSKPTRQSQLYSALINLVPEYLDESLKNRRKEQSIAFRPLQFSVLLAEDNLINQEVALNMLDNFACNVEVVSNGQAALDACENTKFDIIMMDCVMPILNGFEATQLLRSSDGINSETPVLALTANVSVEGEKRCYESGMNDYICKPVKQNELYRRLDKWTEIIDSQSESTSSKQSLTQDQLSGENISTKVNTNDFLTSKNSVSSIHGELKNNYPGLDITNNPIDETKSLSGNEVINTVALDNIRKLQQPGRPDLYQKIVKTYLDKTPVLIDELVVGLEVRDFVKIRDAAHGIKSSSAYIGAEAFSVKMGEIEIAAANEELEALLVLMASLQDEYRQLSAHLYLYVDQAA